MEVRSTLTSVEVRPLTERDLARADRIFRLAFGTFLGVPDPASFAGDADFVTTRWRADPSAALAAVQDGELVGSNFVTSWGSVGLFGPLTVRPDLWDQGVAQRLLEPTVAMLDERGAHMGGLFTFSHSPKHVGLYQRFGFWPQQLTAVLARPVVAPTNPPQWSTLSAASDRDAVVTACAGVTGAIYDGFDVRRELHAVTDQRLGETVLIANGDQLDAFAVCHLGAGSEAGSGTCFVKVGAVRPGPAAGAAFARLLVACDDLAAQRGASVLMAGVNTARREAYAALLRRGYRAEMLGVAMTRPDDPGYNRAGVYVVDDWR